MSAPVIATPVFLIPENAPFTAEQRAWLSGLFAATLAPQGLGATALGGGEAARACLALMQWRARLGSWS